MFAVTAARFLCWYQNSSHTSVSFWNTFFFYDNSWKDSKICKAKFLCKIEIKVQVSPIHRSTTVDILLFLSSGWVLKCSSLKVLYSLADVVRWEPLQGAWLISKLITIWFWSYFSLFFSYSWYFNWSLYLRSPSFLYYLRSGLTYVGIYLPPIGLKFFRFSTVYSCAVSTIDWHCLKCAAMQSIHQCKHQGIKLQKIFRLIWYEDLLLFAALSQATFCKKIQELTQ